MKVVAIELSTNVVRVVLVDGDASSFDVPFREEWLLSSANRCDDYVQIRKRLADRVKRWTPDVVCVEPVEPIALRKASGGMMQTAELRGIVAEAAASEGASVEFPYKATIKTHLGGRDAATFAKDEAEWQHLGADFLKKYRAAATIAVSHLRKL